MEIIDDAVIFKKRFFPGNYGYETMKKGSISLKITDMMKKEFINDYESMKEMIFDDKIPTIEEIIDFLTIAEQELNF